MKVPMNIAIAIGLGLKRNGHIFLGMIAGVIVGILLHSHVHNGVADSKTIEILLKVLDFIGQVFIRLIQMIVIPLVFSAIIIGVSSVGDNKQLGKIGQKIILYYGLFSVIAATLGAGLALIFKPGQNVPIEVTNTVDIQQIVSDAYHSQKENLTQIFVNLIPDNPIASLANGDFIPIIVFVLILALALSKIGEINRPVVAVFESIFAATMKLTDWIMLFAAPAVFSLIALTFATHGFAIFGSIGKFVGIIILGCMIQLFLIYPAMMKIFSKVPVIPFFSGIAEAMIVAFGTASSSATLPLTIGCCEKRGISHKVSSFVLPLGATLNMDATAMFQVAAVIFLTQAYGVILEPIQILQIAVLAIVASSTCAGIPGAGLITIAVVLTGLGLTPEQLIEGFAFLLAIDRLLEMFRTVNNVTSDAVIAAIIADNENEINYDLLINTELEKETV